MLSERHSFLITLPRKIRSQVRIARDRFPMVGLLAIAAVSVGIEPVCGEVSVIAFLVSFLSLALWNVLSSGKKHHSATPLLLLSLALATCFSFYQGRQRKRIEAQVRNWQSTLDRIGPGLSGGQWQPVALRGSIEQAVKYRRATVLNDVSNRAAADQASPVDPTSTAVQQLAWQTLTLLDVTEVRTGAIWKPVSMRVPLTIDERVPSLLPGNRVEVYCQWRLPSEPSNPGQRDATRYFADLGYAAQAKTERSEQIVSIGEPDAFRIDRVLARISGTALSSIERHVPFGQSTLACALILGQRDMAAWQLQEELLATGSIHMLSISGMHIEMISSALLVIGVVAGLKRTLVLPSVCIIIWCYALLCGANPPVIRAAIMLTAAFIAQCMRWQYSSLNNLALAGLVLMMDRPSVLFEIGTQLSFMAVAVLIVTSERLIKSQSPLRSLIANRSAKPQKWFAICRSVLWEMIRMSFWVWFITAPLVWTGFHVISPIAIMLNLFLWIPMLIALITGLGMIFAGWIWPVGALLGLICGMQLWIVDKVVEYGERVSFGHFWSPAPPMLWLYGFYAIGIGCTAMFGIRKIRGRRILLRSLVLWFLLGLSYHPIRNVVRFHLIDAERMTLTFLDVGHGAHLWIETPDNKLWCYDAGRMGDHERSYRTMVDALWANGHSQIDTLLLSHADADHFNAMPGILHRFSARRFVTTPQVLSHPDPLLATLTMKLQSLSVPTTEWKRGDFEEHPQWQVMVLHPPPMDVGRNDNANSLCLVIEYAGRKVFLPGDLEPPGTAMVLAQPSMDVDVLLAPHHGSLHAQADKVLEWCDPDIVVISGSQRAVTPKVLDIFSTKDRKLYVTARDHAVRIHIFKNGDIQTQTWQGDSWQTEKSITD